MSDQSGAFGNRPEVISRAEQIENLRLHGWMHTPVRMLVLAALSGSEQPRAIKELGAVLAADSSGTVDTTLVKRYSNQLNQFMKTIADDGSLQREFGRLETGVTVPKYSMLTEQRPFTRAFLGMVLGVLCEDPATPACSYFTPQGGDARRAICTELVLQSPSSITEDTLLEMAAQVGVAERSRWAAIQDMFGYGLLRRADNGDVTLHPGIQQLCTGIGRVLSDDTTWPAYEERATMVVNDPAERAIVLKAR